MAFTGDNSNITRTEYDGLALDTTSWWTQVMSKKIDFKIDASSRLTNLSYNAKTWGSFAPITWGTARVEGAIVWASKFRESTVVNGYTRKKAEYDGNGPKFQTNLKYSYRVDVGYSFGFNGHPGRRRFLSRVYMNNTIVYDMAGGYRYPGMTFRFHDGAIDQLPDKSYVADKGGDAIAFRKQMVLFVENLPINDFGAAIPTVWAEIVSEDDPDYEPEEFDNSISADAMPGSQLAFDWERRRVYMILNDIERVGESGGPRRAGIAIFDIDTKSQIAEVALSGLTGTDEYAPITYWGFCPWQRLIYCSMSLGAAIFVIEADTGRVLAKHTHFDDESVTAVPGKFAFAYSENDPDAAYVGFIDDPFLSSLRVAKFGINGQYGGSFEVIDDFGGDMLQIFGSEDQSLIYFGWIDGDGCHVGAVECDAAKVTMDWFTLPPDVTEHATSISAIFNWSGIVVVILDRRGGDDTKPKSWCLGYDSETKELLYETTDYEVTSGFMGTYFVLNSNIENGTFAYPSIAYNHFLRFLDIASGTVEHINTGLSFPFISSAIWDSNTRYFYFVRNGTVARVHGKPPPSQTIRLDEFMADVLRIAGYADDEFALVGINDVIEGAFINQGYDAIRMLDDVAALHRITRTESDGKLRYQKKMPDEGSVEPELLITYADLAWISQGSDARSAIQMNMGSEASTPYEIMVQFINPDVNYQDDSYSYRRPGVTSSSKQSMSLSVPIMMSKERVALLTQNMLYDVWGGQLTGQLRLPRKHYPIDEGTIVQLQHGTFNDIVRINEVTHNGDWSVSASFEVVRARRSARGQVDPYVPTVTRPRGTPSSDLYFFDVPLIDPSHANEDKLIIYMTMAGQGQPYWPGGWIANAPLDEDEETTFSAITNVNDDTSIGRVNNVVEATSGSVTDGLRVLFKGTNPLAALNTTADVLNDNPMRNLAFYGRNGRWELVQWRTSRLDDKGFVIFDGVRRGLRGTEVRNHVTGDVFVPFGMGMRIMAFPNSIIGTTQLFKAVGYGQPIERASTYTFEITAAALKPWSPVLRRLASYDDGDIIVTWWRRDRLGLNTLGSADPLPLSDPPETYDLELLDEAGDVLRTVAGLVSPEWSYTAAQRAVDGLPERPDSLRVRVYQIASTAGVGRGFAGEDTVYVE